MLESLTEFAIALTLIGIVVGLARVRGRIRPRHRGFDLLLVGLLLLSFGGVLDLLDLERLPDSRAGLRDVLLFLQYAVGYTVGILHAAAGVVLWVPAIIRFQREVGARLDAEETARRSRLELEARNAALELTTDLTNRLHRTLDLEAIAAETLAALDRLASPPFTAFYLLDDDGTRLRMVAEKGFAAEEKSLGAHLPVRGSLSGLALAERKILASSDIAADARLEPSVRDALLRRGVRSAMIIPLAWEGEPLGTLNLVYREPHDLDQIDPETLQTIGKTVSLAIANAKHVAGLEHQAFHDTLTGLPNRAALHREFAAARQRDVTAEPGAFVLLDLDRFREINDALGHHVGDELLIQLGSRLAARAGDSRPQVFRLGGDEFVVLLDDIRGVSDAEEKAHEVLAEVKSPFLVRGLSLELAASAGVSVLPDHGSDSHELLRCADVALYAAKRAGVGVVAYSRDLDTHTPERLALMSDLGQAIRDESLRLHFQPKVELGTGAVVGFEALVRWDHPRLGVLSPATFVPLAEAGDLIHDLTFWVVEHALAQLRTWNARAPALTMAINLSMRNLHDRTCADRLRELIRRSGVNPTRVEFEITETALMSDPQAALRSVTPVTATGARLSIDDFGTGYSSLAYLTRFPVHTLKIDGSFVGAINHDPRSYVIVRSTVELGRNLGLAVVAEGVEDRETSATLVGLGCELAQGFFYSPPIPPEEVDRRFDAGELRATG
jgi:diguanylate cyclase (GGDEF)-like protein